MISMTKDNRGKTRWLHIGTNLTLQVISMTKGNRGKARWHSHRSKLNITSDKYEKRQ